MALYTRVGATVALAVLGLCALVALGIAARGGELEETDWRLIGTLAAVLVCGSAALTALRLGVPLAFAAVLPLAAFLFLALAIWNEGLWQERFETMAKLVLTALAATLAVLLVTALRLQVAFTSPALAVAYLAVSALIVVTVVYALVLLWSWDVAFGDSRSENVDNAAQRILIALFALSVLGYLATPLLARVLPPARGGTPR